MSIATAGLALVLSLGFEFGGEKIVDVTYTNGSSSSIEAGRGISLNGGVIYRPEESSALGDFEFQGTVGGKFTSTKEATNGNITWSHWPIDALAFWRKDDQPYRLGGGVTGHFGNKLEGSGVASAINVSVDNAVGFVVAGDYFYGAEKNVMIGGRYTSIKYKANGSTVDGNNFGVVLAVQWPQAHEAATTK